ncbi:MAG: hypothetical protein DRP45_03350 [Candidatus Zixiibacteriota bacterium]|nr:MAG: hypothetical protein DRP45_03350 [candidate division Zixibacteria bacterium]
MVILRNILRTWLTTGLLIVVGAGLCYAEDYSEQVIPGSFVVKLTSSADRTVIKKNLGDDKRLIEPSKLQVNHRFVGGEAWDRVLVLQSEDTTISVADIEAIVGSQNIEYLEPVYVLEFFDYPSDPLFGYQWYLNNTGQDYFAVERIEGYYNDTLKLEHGTPGNDAGIGYYYEHPPASTTSVVVAIVDSGVDTEHPELQGRFWKNPDEIPNNGLDDDHNGFIDDTLGFDVSGDIPTYYDPVPDNDPTDIIGHGTHIAGIIASNIDGVGIAGMTPGAEIMAVKVRPNASSVIGAMGIVYAVVAGADVINVSWGTQFDARVLQEALEFARANGVFVSIAAGNTGGNHLMYPAAFEDAFAVAASNSSGYITWFSTWGEHIDVVAPGEHILSLRAIGTDMYEATGEPNVHIIGEDSLYYLAGGTSMAAPVAAGAAATLWSLRPDLTLDQLETMLRMGATDMLDPLNVGDSLPGPDSISGYGHLHVRNSLVLADFGGIYFVEPIPRNRYVGQVTIKAAPIGGYVGGWELAFSSATDPDNWQELASGSSLPTDSVLHTLSLPGTNGHITFRLTDNYGVERFVTIVLVSEQCLEITSPEEGVEYTYNVPIEGSIQGQDLDSAAIYYRYSGGPLVLLHETTGEYFDSLIFSWNASGIDIGDYTLYLYGYFHENLVIDSINFVLASAFADGWPRDLTGRAALSAACADLDNDGQKEIIVGTWSGLNVFHSNGEPLDSFPALPETDLRCIPAVYDVDRDGEKEIICTGENGIYVFNHDGSLVPGWPVNCKTGRRGYGFPNPTVTGLNAWEDSAIVIVNEDGHVMAYEFDGSPYFYSLEGWFASFNSRPYVSYFWGGNSVSGVDLDGDSRNEVVVTYSALRGRAGVAVFEGRTGLPAWDRPLPHVLVANVVYGSVLADLNGDGLPEIITCGYDSTYTRTLWAKTHGVDDLEGWPVRLPDLGGWRGSYPMVTDLDLDGSLEVICTFFDFDLGTLYVFRADGSPYVSHEGRPPGEAHTLPTTFGTAIVANLTGDEHPEVIIRSGYFFPNTGREQIHILDYTLSPIPGWPVATPTSPSTVFSTPYTPMVDDIDADGLVELVVVSEGSIVYVWNFDAPANNGANRGRLLQDNLNSNLYPVQSDPTAVDEELENNIPHEFSLQQNYPNPFNPTTIIAFDVPARTHATLEVFNILGRRVTTLVDGDLPAGHYTAEFDGSQYASGVYLYRLKTGDHESVRKMVLLK